MKIALEPSSPATALQPPSDLERLRKAARDFESIMLTSLWKGMQTGMEDEEDEEGELGGKSGPLQEVAMQALASQAVRGRGIGIAQMIVHSMAGKVSGGQTDSKSQEGTGNASQTAYPGPKPEPEQPAGLGPPQN